MPIFRHTLIILSTLVVSWVCTSHFFVGVNVDTFDPPPDDEIMAHLKCKKKHSVDTSKKDCCMCCFRQVAVSNMKLLEHRRHFVNIRARTLWRKHVARHRTAAATQLPRHKMVFPCASSAVAWPWKVATLHELRYKLHKSHKLLLTHLD